MYTKRLLRPQRHATVNMVTLYQQKLHYNGKTYTHKHDIVNQFNEYFINIGLNLASTIHSSIKPDAFLPATHSSSFFLSRVDSAQVELALSGLDRHKATIDIPNYLIKIASNLLSTPLTNLFNESIESGIVPDIFEISKVTPVWCSDRPWQLPSHCCPLSVF